MIIQPCGLYCINGCKKSRFVALTNEESAAYFDASGVRIGNSFVSQIADPLWVDLPWCFKCGEEARLKGDEPAPITKKKRKKLKSRRKK